MGTDRWRQVTDIFHRALEHDSGVRAAFVAEACASDPRLQADVEALLTAHAHAGAFGETPVVGSIARQLAAGTQVGPYRIEALIGAGGMGEVYRATDARLRRSVAIKVLPASVAADANRVARFEREAQMLAALNHPNIAHIYGMEDADCLPALVMEYVDGPTLADRVDQGATSFAEALPILRQIALALEAAHDRGIIHRDLKPANVKLTPDSTVKVLDFGLAKAMADSAGSRTLVASDTRDGVLLGSAAYMSPEQAARKAVDKRTDVWAFGCVAYELLTADAAFPGDSVAETLAAVLTREPDWTRLPSAMPARVCRLLQRCLDKDPRQRLHDIADARLELEDTAAGEPVPEAAPGSSSRRSRIAYAAIAASITAAALVAALWLRVPPPGIAFPVYATIEALPGAVFGEDDPLVSLPTRTPIVFTPDGKVLIIQAARDHKPQLFLRRLDSNEMTPIAGTEDARTPFVSPDGRWIGFASEHDLRKVPIGGGTPTTICTRCDGGLGPAGASWGPHDRILVGDQGGTAGIAPRIQLVSATGGELQPVTPRPGRQREHVSPFFLPDGERFLFSDVSQTDASDTRLMVQSIRGGEPRLVMERATDGRLLPTGQLVFMRLGTLMVAGFDQRTATVTTTPTTERGQVMQSALRSRSGANDTGEGMFAVSSLGTLALINGPLPGTGQRRSLVWIDHEGRATAAEPASGGPDGTRGYARISADGSRIATTVIAPMRASAWFLDPKRGVWTECRECGRSVAKAWSPDGERILIFPEGDSIVEHTIDGSAADRVLIREPHRIISPAQWLPDGRIVYVSERDIDGMTREIQPDAAEIKLWTSSESTPRTIVTDRLAQGPEVSPNGRWLAYSAMDARFNDAPAPSQVFVQAFPGAGKRIQISQGNATNPAWSPDGKTLYYVELRRGLFAVDVDGDGAVFAAGPPRLLFRDISGGCRPVRCFDVSRDGSRFLTTEPAATTAASVTRMELILNWTSLLSK